jgi:trk system potassium uptake protein
MSPASTVGAQRRRRSLGGLARSNRRRKPGSPARTVVSAFAAAILIGTALLALPVARTGPGGAGFLAALFTSTSAVTVTGLTIVDTPTHWSNFGEAVILVLMQVGGFGIMTLSTLVALLVSHRIGLRHRMRAQAEIGALRLGDVRSVVRGVLAFTVAFEAAAMVVLTLVFWLRDDVAFGTAAFRGVFHAVSAFNNAGFALFSDSLMGYVTDPLVIVPIGVLLTFGGLGFPVLLELWHSPRRARRWSLHTKLTVGTSVVLVVGATLGYLVLEWSNGATFGDLNVAQKVLAGWFQGITPRTAGFNSVDFGEMRQESWLLTNALMFIGGGSASTAGGIKVTTFATLGFVIWAEVRGDPDVSLFGRRLPTAAQRQALTIALIGIGAVILATMALMVTSEIELSQALFEALSAFSTVGLTTGITVELSTAGHLILIALMFLGRVGPITLFAALVLRERELPYRYPEERPIIG